ncbi:hypothetical protein BGX34_001714 [Mortierella sp. NVP85]|nr:hypothetical protein BGX34_001714 [Mortierella sp. NVP85]
MLCFGISEQEIEIALVNTKDAFCNNTAVADEPTNPEQCIRALKTAVDTLTKIKKDGKRALNKDQNIGLKKVVEEAYVELTRLQVYYGPDKAQKCLKSLEDGGVKYIPEPKQPPPPPPPPQQQQQQLPVHQSRRSVDSASLSSGGTHSIPDQFYQADVASRSGGIDIYEEKFSVGNTPESSKVDLDVLHIDEPKEDQGRPREHYVKHTGCFADAAPRTEHSPGDADGLFGNASTSIEADREDPFKDGIQNPETSEAASAAPPQETPTSSTSEYNSEISETRNIQVIALARALFDFAGKNEGDLPFKVGNIINVIEFVDDNWWRGVLGKDVGIFPKTYVQLKPPPNGKYPTISVQINSRQPTGRPLTGGNLPPAGQGQLAGHHDNTLAPQSIYYDPSTLGGAPTARYQGNASSQQPLYYDRSRPFTPTARGGAPAAEPQGYPSSQQLQFFSPSALDGSPVARPSPPTPLSGPAGLPPQASQAYFPPSPTLPRPQHLQPIRRDTNGRPSFTQGQRSFQDPTPHATYVYPSYDPNQDQLQSLSPISPQQYAPEMQQSFQSSLPTSSQQYSYEAQQQQPSMPTQAYKTYVPNPYIPPQPREQQFFQQQQPGSGLGNQTFYQ